MEDLPAPPLACPQCASRLVRVPRHFGDRLVSLFVPVLRCRCAAGICNWEGLVRRDAAVAAGLTPNDVYATRQVLEASRGRADA